MLASVVIKIEYRRTLHQGSVGIARQPSIPHFPATKKSSIPGIPEAFLTGSGLRTEMAGTHSKQTTGAFLTGSRIACQSFKLSGNFGVQTFAPAAKSVNQSRPHGRP